MPLILNTNTFKNLALEKVLEFYQKKLNIFHIEITTDGKAHAYPAIGDQEKTDDLVRLVSAMGSRCHIISGGWTDFATGDIKLAKKQFALAESLRADNVRFFASNPKVELEFSDKVLGKIIKNIKKTVKNEFIGLLIENHGGVFHNPINLQRLMKVFNDHPNVGLVYDPANFTTDNIDPLHALTLLRPWVKHVHVKDVKSDGTYCAVGEGIVPWKAIYQTLQEGTSYKGDYSIEYEDQTATTLQKIDVLARSIAFMKGLMDEQTNSNNVDPQ